MELSEAIRIRRSVRRFTEEKVSDEMIETMLRSAMNAPSACRKDPWDFYVVKKEEVLEELMSAGKYTHIKAPLAIVICGNTTRCIEGEFQEYWIQDCSAATENLLLTAVDLGLGAVWCGVHPQKENLSNVRRILSLKDEQIPLNIIYIGHPEAPVRPHDRYNPDFVTVI